jgi:hypothetical protein
VSSVLRTLLRHLTLRNRPTLTVHDRDEFESDERSCEDEDDTVYGLMVRSATSIASPILLEGLTAAAEKGNANAHYALALIHDPLTGRSLRRTKCRQ